MTKERGCRSEQEAENQPRGLEPDPAVVPGPGVALLYPISAANPSGSAGRGTNRSSKCFSQRSNCRFYTLASTEATIMDFHRGREFSVKAARKVAPVWSLAFAKL